MIEFKPIPPDDQPEQSASPERSAPDLDRPRPPAGPPPAPVDLPQLQKALFDFILSLLDGRPQARRALLAAPPTLAGLQQRPRRPLVEALRRRLDDCLVQFGPDASVWGPLALSPAVWSLALAAHNCLAPAAPEPLPEFMAALLESVPPARRPADMLAYHALLQPLAGSLDGDLPERQSGWLAALLHRSPLTAVSHLHHFTPPPLIGLAAELLPHWRRRQADPAPWPDLEAWLAAAALLIEQPRLGRYLRRRWLALPQSRAACRNLGLLLEGLRRRDSHRAFILEFYEAYEYHRAETRLDGWNRPRPTWPLLLEIERLLRAGHDLDPGHEAAQEAALRLNRRGNEFYLLFYPLVQLIIAESGPLKDYRHLQYLPQALRPLLARASVGTSQRLELAEIQFEEQPD